MFLWSADCVPIWLAGNFTPGCGKGMKGFEKENVHGSIACDCERAQVEQVMQDTKKDEEKGEKCFKVRVQAAVINKTVTVPGRIKDTGGACVS